MKGYVDDVDLERKKGKWVYEVEIKKAALNIKYMSMQKLEKR